MARATCRARKGDRVSLEGRKVGKATREGTIIGVLGEPGRERWDVRWDDGRASVVTPSSDLRTERPAPKAPAAKKPAARKRAAAKKPAAKPAVAKSAAAKVAAKPATAKPAAAKPAAPKSAAKAPTARRRAPKKA